MCLTIADVSVIKTFLAFSYDLLIFLSAINIFVSRAKL